jgi:GTP-binding protein HflX
VDRRALRARIRSLRHALDRIARQRHVGRKRRSDAFRVSLVGYTNAGKSTLMRALSGADVFVEDRLFATLDSTTRSVYLGYNREILLTDTVGFIRKLPHHLVASFRSTLEEAVEADLLLHVVDASHPACEEQIVSVFETLEELGIADRPTLMVLNKMDALPEPGIRLRLSADHPEGVWVSAVTGDGLDDLRSAVYERLEEDRVTLSLQVPQSDGRLLSSLHAVGEILSRQFQGNDVLLEVRMSRAHADRMLPEGKYQIKA